MTISIKKKPIIKTERFIIKPIDFKDKDDLIELITNPIITRTFMVPQYESFEQIENLAKKIIFRSQIDNAENLFYGIYIDKRLIGFINDCGFKNKEIEIGYAIHPDYQGCGYATEAVKTIFKELKEMGFNKVIACHFEDNVASGRVMEKCGMYKTDVINKIEYRNKCHNCLYYEIIL